MKQSTFTRMILFALALCVLLGLAPLYVGTASAADTTSSAYCNLDFETTTGLPEGWSWVNTASTFNASTVTDPLDTTKENHALLVSNPNSGSVMARYRFEPHNASDKATVTAAVLEYDFYASSAAFTYLPTFETFTNGGGAKVFIWIDATGNLRNNKTSDTASFTQNAWNHVKLDANFSTKSFTLSLNGTAITSGTLDNANAVNDLFFPLSKYTGLYLDNIKVTTPDGTKTYCEQKFETVSGLPDKWSWYGSNSFTIATTADPLNAANRVVSASGAQTGNADYAIYPFTTSAVSEAVLEYDFYAPDNKSKTAYLPTFQVSSTADGAKIFLAVGGTNSFSCVTSDYSGWGVATYDAAKWNHVKLVAHFNTRTYEVWLNGTKLTTSGKLNGSASVNTLFWSVPDAYAGTVSIDNLKVSPYVEPAASNDYCKLDFETGTELPEDWSWAAEGTEFDTAIVENPCADETNSSGKVLKVDNTTSAAITARYRFEPLNNANATVSQAVLEYDFYTTATTGATYLPTFEAYTAAGGAKAFLQVNAKSGKFSCVTGSYAGWDIAARKTDAWNHVKFCADFAKNRFDCYLNGQWIATGSMNGGTASVNDLFFPLSANYAGLYLDNITVSRFTPATGVSELTLGASDIYSGESTTATLTATPDNSSMLYTTFTSSAPGVATVDALGVVTGVDTGTATITATCKVGNTTVTKTADIHVTKTSIAVSADYEAKAEAELAAWQGAGLANTRLLVETDELDPDNHVLTMESYRSADTNYSSTVSEYVKYTLPLTVSGTDKSASVRKAVLKYRLYADYNSNAGNGSGYLYLPNFVNENGDHPVELLYQGSALDVGVYSNNRTMVKMIGSGQWYDIEWMVDLDAGIYDLYVDGECIISHANIPTMERISNSKRVYAYDENGEPIYHTNTLHDNSDTTIKNRTSSLAGIDMGMYKNADASISIDDLQILDYTAATGWSIADDQLKEVAVGNSIPLKLQFTTANGQEASCRSAKIESSDLDVAVIDYNGNIIGKRAGRTTITITPYEAGLEAKQFDLMVLGSIPVTDLGNVADLQLPVGGHKFIDAVITPVNASAQTLTYSSSDASVASVDEWGEIVAHKAGSAVITVTAGSYSKTMTVTVNEPGVMTTYTVTDAASLLKAIADISKIDKSTMTGNIVVNLSAGYYQLADTLKLNETHGGNGEYSVIFRGEGDVTLGGGLQIAGSAFTLDEETGIYSVSVPAGTQTRQLFVDNVRATRARTNNEEDIAFTELTEGGTSVGLVVDMPEIADYDNQDGVEFVFRYSFPHFRVGLDHAVADGSSVKLYMDMPGWVYAQASFVHAKSGGHTMELLYIENALELLDEPGEWYLDESTNTLYYMPRDFEDMSEVTITLPVVDGLLSVEGTTPEKAVQNISFENITFADATWMRPSTKVNYNVTQNSAINEYVDQIHRTYMPDASVTVKWANGVNFTGCTFTRLGSTALYLENGVQNSSITENKVYDCSGVGIQIGDVGFGHMGNNQVNNYNPTDRTRLIKNIDVLNNYIHDIGVDYKSSAGIGLAFAANVTISYNEIFNVPYSGMHIGYGWNAVFENILVNAKITHNYIHDYLLVMNDGAAIYTLGNTGGTAANPNVIAENYLTYIWNANAPIYHDNGSSFWHDYQNVIDVSNIDIFPTGIQIPAWTFINTYSHDIWMDDNYASTGRSVIASGNTSNLNISDPTVFEDGNWTGEALEIANAAGLNTAKAAALRNGHAEVIVENIPDSLELVVSQTFEAELSFQTGRRKTLNSNAAVYYAVDDPTIASVDANGKLTALKNGATTFRVYVLSNDILTEYTCKLYIGAELAQVQLRNVESDTITQTIAGAKTYEAYGISDLGNELKLDSATFVITDTSIAKADNSGKITPVAIGETTLTVTGTIGETSVSQTFTLKITDVDGGKIAYGTPTLDGVLDDVYLSSTKITFGSVFYPSATATTDTDGYAYLAWDEDYLYCYIYVADGDVVSKGAGDITDLYNWTTAAVETFVTMVTKNAPNGRQVKFAMDAFGLGVYTEGGIGEDVEALAATLPYFTAFTYNGEIVKNYKIETPTMNQKAGTDEQPVNGYVIEMTLPLFTNVNDAANTALHGGDQIDFQIQLNDYDGGGTDNASIAAKVVARHNSKSKYYLMSAPETPVDKTALKSAIDAAEALDLSKYQDGDDKTAFTAALTAAKTVYADANAKQTDVDAALKALNEAVAKLSIVYTITYDFNDKDITNKTKLQPQNPTSYTSDSETITLNPITSKGVSGKVFYEWRDEDGNAVTEIPTGSTGNITLKAYWKYPVNYHFLDEDGNEISKLTEYFVEDAYADYTLAVAEDRNGCTFDGWYQAKKDIGKESKKTTSIYMTKKFELYGQYIADPTARVLTITYDAFGGEGAPEVQTYTFAEGEEYTLLPISSVIPTREGYKFCGWSRIKPQNPWDADLQAGANWFVRWADVEGKDGNVTLYAVWEKI